MEAEICWKKLNKTEPEQKWRVLKTTKITEWDLCQKMYEKTLIWIIWMFVHTKQTPSSCSFLFFNSKCVFLVSSGLRWCDGGQHKHPVLPTTPDGWSAWEGDRDHPPSVPLSVHGPLRSRVRRTSPVSSQQRAWRSSHFYLFLVLLVVLRVRAAKWWGSRWTTGPGKVLRRRKRARRGTSGWRTPWSVTSAHCRSAACPAAGSSLLRPAWPWPWSPRRRTRRVRLSKHGQPLSAGPTGWTRVLYSWYLNDMFGSKSQKKNELCILTAKRNN